MRKDKQTRIARAGWRAGTAQDFLGLSDEEVALVEMKLALADHLRARRKQAGWTQRDLADHIGSSQSRVAKMEAGEGSVTLDLLIRALLSLGVTRREVARVLGREAA